MVDVMKMA